MLYIDTNTLIYAALPASPYSASSFDQIKQAVMSGTFAINEIVLTEFYSVMTNGKKIENPWTSEEACSYIRALMESAAEVHYINEEIQRLAFETAGAFDISKYMIYDHLIACSMKFFSIDTIVTVNKDDFQKYPFIKNIVVPEKKHE